MAMESLIHVVDCKSIFDCRLPGVRKDYQFPQSNSDNVTVVQNDIHLDWRQLAMEFLIHVC